MKRIAIVGGGIAGVCAAYGLARQQQAGAPVEFILFESTGRLGGIVETERRDGFIFECGPDGWVTEKPDARTLAVELGLESEIIFSQDTQRKTYIAQGSTLIAMPDGMRMMVPSRWASMLRSPLFSARAKLAYLREPGMAERLNSTALAIDPSRDESVRDFVFRHFGPEVADKVAAPLLAGVFGGNISSLSARAVLPAYVEMEREYGSLITALQKRRRTGDALPMFSTLRNGLAELVEKMASHIPAKGIRLSRRVNAIENLDDTWQIHSASDETSNTSSEEFDAVLVATPAEATKQLLGPLDAAMARLLPDESSSSVVVNLAFAPASTQTMRLPRGFGFLVPQAGETASTYGDGPSREPDPIVRKSLLACTFVDQKFPHRAPPVARLLRAFLGGPNVSALMSMDDSQILSSTLAALGPFLDKLPRPDASVIRRLPDSLPLYPVGHLGRIAELETRLTKFPHLRLIGNAYQGVGLPDVIRTSRSAVREMLADLIDWRAP